ncbi:MAG: type II toxin-antitoxin system RelE/ParE family toxin [Christensenellaceae bacterium]
MESNEQYRVKYTQTALKRLYDILAYIAVTLCNPSAAKRLLDDFDEAIENVSKFPYAMPKAKNKNVTTKEYRKIFVRQYLAIYRIDEKKKAIYILTFRYAPRFLGDSI